MGVMPSMTKKRYTWTWADYHREVKRMEDNVRRTSLTTQVVQLLVRNKPDLVDLAHKIRSCPRTLKNWLTGKNYNGSPRYLERVADELGYELKLVKKKVKNDVSGLPSSKQPYSRQGKSSALAGLIAKGKEKYGRALS